MAGCNGGMCGAKPAQFATAGTGCGSLKIAYANGNLYWADKGHGIIDSVATATGSLATIATGELSPFDIVVSMGNVYWINGGNQTVRKVKESGGTVTTLATGKASVGGGGPGTIHAIAVSADGSTIYYAHDACIYMVSTTDATATTACAPRGNGNPCATISGSACVGSSIESAGIPSALAVDAMNVYYPSAQSGNVEFLSLATGLQFKVAQSQGSLLVDTIYVDGGHLYWVNGEEILDSTAFIIGPDAGIGGTVARGDLGAITAFAVGATSIYYAMQGYVDKAPRTTSGGGANGYVVARNIPVLDTPMPNSIALDGTNVYFTTGDCQIMVVANGPQ
jgi:hypothetical protein